MILFAWLVSFVLGGVGPSGQIAFVSGTEQEDQCVCVVDLPTGTVTRVGPGQLDGAPVWSPDGTRLAFQTRNPEGLSICIANPDDSGSQILTHAYKWNRNPRWSPDGVSLAYESDNGDTLDRRLVVYDTRSNVETPWGGERTGLMRPVWMPNLKILNTLRPDAEVQWGNDQQGKPQGIDWLKGNAALLAIGLTGEPGKLQTDIFIVTEASSATPSSRGAYVEWGAEPSPNGWDIAFESNDGGDREIFVLSRRVTADVSNHRAADWNPVWSPDGEWIAFESFRGGRRGVYRVYPETARVVPIAADPAVDNWAPTWSPDGLWIAFVSNRTGDSEIFASDVAGKNVRQVTDHPGLDCAPAWRPNGKK